MLTAITHARLLDCFNDEPIENANVLIENGTIREVSTGEGHLRASALVIDACGKTVMPGLIDAHDHFAITTNDMGAVLFDPPFLTSLRIKAQLEKILKAGFTTVRDGGGGHWTHRQAVRDGLIAGPRLLICGPLISATGGHGDFNTRGELTFPPNNRVINLMHLVDGEAECRKAAREQFQLGTDHLKICITGGCASPNDEPWQVHLSEGEIRAFVEEANAHGIYVMAHSLNDDGNCRAVECGVGTIEHGAFLSDRTARLMKERGVHLVSTMAVVAWAEQYGKEQGAAEWFTRKLANPNCSPDGASILEGLVRGVQAALRAGVAVGSGADFFGTMCGGEAMNIKLLVDLGGMTPYQALQAATRVNAEIIRLKERLGTVEPGKWADLLIIDGEPDRDINVITQPSKIRMVMKEGQIMKNTLN